MSKFLKKIDWRLWVLSVGLGLMIDQLSVLNFFGILLTTMAISWDWRMRK